jgi:hypothetical protein
MIYFTGFPAGSMIVAVRNTTIALCSCDSLRGDFFWFSVAFLVMGLKRTKVKPFVSVIYEVNAMFLKCGSGI